MTSPARLGLTATLAVFVVSGCASHLRTVNGSGNIVTRNYPVSGFDHVEVGSALNVEIQQGPEFALRMTADDNAFDAIRVRHEGGRLRIDTHSGMQLRNVEQSAVLVMPDIKSLDVSGAADVVIQSFRVPHRVEFDLSGASDLSGQIDAGDLALDLSGASDARLAGTASHCRVDGSGASDAMLRDLRCSHAALDLSGSADADVTALVELGPVELSGASTLVYGGSAALRDISTSGAASVHRR